MKGIIDVRCILLFAKYPEQGRVKTRLSLQLPPGCAEELYRAFVFDSLSLLELTGIPFSICYYPHDDKARFTAWLGSHYSFIPQHGNDLGERVRNCFCYAFSQGFQRVIALGTDSPDLPSTFIKDAFAYLQKHDSVIGPCEDGGYYLIGFNKDTFLPNAFDRISWSTDSVVTQTIDRLKRAGRTTHILPRWRDVDTMNDLKHLYKQGLRTTFKKSRTMALLTGRYSTAFQASACNKC